MDVIINVALCCINVALMSVLMLSLMLYLCCINVALIFYLFIGEYSLC
jgi:hypothetical protein